jgi:hypothetical protein
MTMPKLKLEIDALAVESFDTAQAGAVRGTVEGNATFFGTNGCYSCDLSRCVETCGDTCDNSLDYCTCACTANCTAVRCHHISDAGSCPCYTDPA